MSLVLSKEDQRQLKEKLRECKQEWLEKNARNQNALGVWTVQQILDNAVEGITTWDFTVEEQWREEINKFNKSNGRWEFDGYVYHVRGSITIKGLGKRTQYGSKVATGGKDNQNSSYKSAASDCLKKCASLFGVGSSIYSKIIIESDDDGLESQQAMLQITHPNGVIQQGEWFWVNNNWIHINEYYVYILQSQNPVQTEVTHEEKQQWYKDTMKQYDPKGYQKMENENRLDQQKTNEAISYADQQARNQNTDYPFENVPRDSVQPNQFEAKKQQEAIPKGEAQQQSFEAKPRQYGAPVMQSETKANNPWDTPENMRELHAFHQHKERLGVKNDSMILPHIRDYFKDENAGLNSITPETLKGFNLYLQNIHA